MHAMQVRQCSLLHRSVLRTANLILSMASKARGDVLFAAARKSYCFGLMIHAHQYKSLPKQTPTWLDTLVSQLNAHRFNHGTSHLPSHHHDQTFPVSHTPVPNSRLAPPPRHSSSPHKAACNPNLQLATTPPPRLCILPHLSHPIMPLWQCSLRTRPADASRAMFASQIILSCSADWTVSL
jgi:hypothetical protein